MNVPRNSYAFTPDGRFIFYLVKSTIDATYALNVAPLSVGTLGGIDPITAHSSRGLDNTPLNRQAFFSPTGKYLIIGVAAARHQELDRPHRRRDRELPRSSSRFPTARSTTSRT